MRTFNLAVLFVLIVSGCAPTGVAVTPNTAPISVEGSVTVRGNEPFTGVWLETDANNVYVLVLSDTERRAMVNPARYRATGRVYADTWNGLRLAHLDVATLERIDRADGS